MLSSWDQSHLNIGQVLPPRDRGQSDGGELRRQRAAAVTAQSESLFIFQRKIAGCFNSNGYQNTTGVKRPLLSQEGPNQQLELPANDPNIRTFG